MELHIQSEFDCIYLINGELVERADAVAMNEYDVAYVTALPLDHRLLPYTVKIVNADGINDGLALGIRLSSEHYLLVLSPRLPVIYRSERPISTAAASRISRLFAHVKNGDTDKAYAMLSDALKAHIDKKTLESFFESYERIVDCPWENGNKFYLITKSGACKLHTYSVADGFIDDITEIE